VACLKSSGFPYLQAPFPQVDIIGAMVIVRREEGKLSGLFCAILCATIVHSAMHTHIIIIIIIINDNVYGAVIVTMVTARVHPVHLMNAD